MSYKPKNRQARIDQNNDTYGAVSDLKKTVRKLTRDGFTVLKMSFDGKGLPKIQIQNCKHCCTLGGAMFRTENNAQGKKFTWQKMLNNCRIEWVTTGELK